MDGQVGARSSSNSRTCAIAGVPVALTGGQMDHRTADNRDDDQRDDCKATQCRKCKRVNPRVEPSFVVTLVWHEAFRSHEWTFELK